MNNSVTQSLAAGQIVTEKFNVTITDNSGNSVTQQIVVKVEGTNDGPTVDASAASAFTETNGSQNLVQAGTVDFDDIDANDVVDISASLQSGAVWSGGTINAGLAAALEAGFTATATDAAAPGQVAWNYAVNGVNLDFLSAGESITLTFLVTATDSASATATDTVTITINGTNDAPDAVNNTASVNEDATTANLRASLLGNDTDPDNGETATLRISAVTQGAKGSVTFNNNGTPLDGSDDTVTYTADGAVLDALAVGQSTTDTFTYTVTDAQGATDTATVTVTINGVDNDITPTVPVDVIGLPADENQDNDSATGVDDGASSGADVLVGTGGNNNIDGLSGNDTIYGAAGLDTLKGSAGDDVIYGQSGNDSLDGTGNNDTIFGGSGNDIILGDTGNDTIYGGTGNDSIDGGGGDDLIYGGSGNDTITGSGNNDQIVGGIGKDFLTGNNNTDTFVFANGHSSLVLADADVITDFAAGEQIDLGNAGTGIFQDVGTGFADYNAALAAANTALNTAVLYAFADFGGNGYLFEDYDADGSADQVVVLTGVTSFSDSFLI